MSKQVYGWKKDKKDTRDFLYRVPAQVAIPTSIDLTDNCPPIYDQGQLGSCTANASACALEYDAIFQQEGQVTPSRLFIYYNTRSLEGTVQTDAGASIRDTIKSVSQFGACPETEWPYDITTFANEPNVSAYDDALKHKAVLYQSVTQDEYAIKFALVSGKPVVFGFNCYDSLEYESTAQTGYIPYPDINNENIIGGHAICIVGYDDSTQKFTIRNSWGTSWGVNGYGTMDYKYVLDNTLASDFWVIETVQ